jgi:hypothetical protein
MGMFKLDLCEARGTSAAGSTEIGHRYTYFVQQSPLSDVPVDVGWSLSPSGCSDD